MKIDPSLAKPEEIEILEDLIVAAANDARGKAEAQAGEKMKALTAGLACRRAEPAVLEGRRSWRARSSDPKSRG